MLVLSPESSCDICAESYTMDSSPHSIPCGHTFCAPCLSKIAQGLWSPRTHPACPLCRESFAQSDIRLIRIDPPSAGYPNVHPYPNYFPAQSSSSSSSASAASKFGTVPIDEEALDHVDDDQRVKIEAKRLEDKVAAAAKKKCTFEEISSLQREVEQWLSKELQRRPDREHASLRLSAALLGAILVNGFAYNEAKKSAKGVEVTLKDKLESAEQVKRKLEMELHKQRSQYTQKFFECQQLKQDLQRYTGGGTAPTSPVSAPVARPLGSSLVQPNTSTTTTPPRPLTAQPSRVSTPMSRSATPLASRASTPGIGANSHSHYSTYGHFPRRSASIAAAAENTSHLPIGSATTTTSFHYPHSVSAPGSSSTSPERPASQTYGSHSVYGSGHQRWIPPSSSREEEDPEVAAAQRARQRPASALGSYGTVRMARPQTSVGGRS